MPDPVTVECDWHPLELSGTIRPGRASASARRRGGQDASASETGLGASNAVIAR